MLAIHSHHAAEMQIRVMPRCWYVLLRFFLRVDKVLVKLRETRMFCPFSDATTVGPVIREVKYSEGTFEELSQAGAPPDGVRPPIPGHLQCRGDCTLIVNLLHTQLLPLCCLCSFKIALRQV